MEESRELLPGSSDFDHDWKPETVELAAVSGDKEKNQPGRYELRVRTADNRLYWSRSSTRAIGVYWEELRTTK